MDDTKAERNKLKRKTGRNILTVAGDFNSPDIDWQTLTTTNKRYPSRVNQTYLDIVADNDLEQMVDFPTRKDKTTLDIILTSHPSFKVRCKPLPSVGNSDHDIVLYDTALAPHRSRPPRRKIFLWKKADVEGMRQDVKEFANTYQYPDPSTPNALEQMWSDIKQMLSETVEKRVPSKTSAARHTNPWITTSIRRAIRRKQRAHKKARMTGKKKDVDRYRRIQAQTRYEVRQASRKYLEDVSEDYRTNSKRFWSYVKSKKQEADGVAPLKDKQGFLRSNSQNKAEILGDQFRSVFTEEDTTSIPDKGPSPYPDILPIRVSEAGHAPKSQNNQPVDCGDSTEEEEEEEEEEVDVVLLDFSKAFDKVPHQRLLRKLHHYGVRNNTLGWIQLFLSVRIQQVVLKGEHSSPSPVLSGVPQGTVLGPLLFLTYINDLPDVVKDSNTRLFADDALLYRNVCSAKEQSLLQADLDRLAEWENTWQMSFNAGKCNTLHVSPGRDLSFRSAYTLHEQTLVAVSSAKYLGVSMAKDLSWTKHVEMVAANGNRTVGFLRRNLKDCTTEVRKATYTTMVRPTLEYASTVWDPHTRQDIDLLEKVQKRAARFACNCYFERAPGTVTDLLRKLQWDSLETRRHHNRLGMLYRIENGLVDIPPSTLYRPSHSRTSGRNSTAIFQEHSKHPALHNSFVPRTVREWNKLSTETTTASSVVILLSRLRSSSSDLQPPKAGY
ncbi:hypothetical protein ACOMHN_050704 [Nucella lapillus]